MHYPDKINNWINLFQSGLSSVVAQLVRKHYGWFNCCYELSSPVSGSKTKEKHEIKQNVY